MGAKELADIQTPDSASVWPLIWYNLLTSPGTLLAGLVILGHEHVDGRHDDTLEDTQQAEEYQRSGLSSLWDHLQSEGHETGEVGCQSHESQDGTPENDTCTSDLGNSISL